MDSLFVSTDTVQQAVKIIHDSRTVLLRGAFNPTNRSPTVMESCQYNDVILYSDEVQSQKNCFHANVYATDVANDDATDVANDDATDAANDDATDVANDDATEVVNDDATDVATKGEIGHGGTKDKATDVAKKVTAPHFKCLRNAEVATHIPDAAAVLEEGDEETAT